MTEVDSEVRLILLGECCLQMGEVCLDIRPPLAFNVILALGLEKSHSLSRSALGSHLFGHLESSKRGPQVRLVLKRLRHCLEQYECASELIRLSDSRLSLSQPISIDAEVVSADLSSLDRLDQIASPILPGHSSRFAERYRQQIKGRIEVALDEIWKSLDSPTEFARFVRACERLRDNFLLSAPIRSYLCSGFQRLHRFEELTREIQAFDCEWLDAFGQCDRPDIAALAERLTNL